MITKLEIDGFKTFRNFQMEFSPCTVIVGANASGKSNLFDALQLLSRLAETDLKTAFSEQRGEAIELFTQYGENQAATEMFFAVELLVNKAVRDNWGSEAVLKYTRLRYELKIRRAKNPKGWEELLVSQESLVNLKHEEDKWVKAFIPANQLESWCPKIATETCRHPYIKTAEKNGILTIKLFQEDQSGGRETPANAVAQTILSGVNSIDFPHTFAAKEEMRQWKFLQLNPEFLRQPSPYLAKDTITQRGDNLAATLYRIKINDDLALTDISRRLNSLLNNLIDVEVVDDTANKCFLIRVVSEDGREFSSRVLSEGTLRLLTLCVLQQDEAHQSLIGFEEPENGIHPFRCKAVVELLKDLSVDFTETQMPLRQIIINTHSPVLVGEMFNLRAEPRVTVWLAQLVTQIAERNGKKGKWQITKLLPVERGSAPLTLAFSESEKKLTLASVIKYLHSAEFETTIGELSGHE